MNKNNSLQKIESENNITQPTRCMYHSEAVVVDGRIYPVLSVIPVRDENGIPETAEDKIIYLVKGEKS